MARLFGNAGGDFLSAFAARRAHGTIEIEEVMDLVNSAQSERSCVASSSSNQA